MKYGVIYKITNKINNKIYIGQTKRSIKARFSQHLTSKNCCKLYKALNKYKKHNFHIEEIASSWSVEDLNHIEGIIIQQYNSIEKGYNLMSAGKSKKMSEETRLKMSKAKLGRKHSLETKLKMSKAHKGTKLKPRSEEHKRKISAATKGKSRGRFTEEHKRKLSNAHKGKTHSQETKEKIRQAHLKKNEQS